MISFFARKFTPALLAFSLVVGTGTGPLFAAPDEDHSVPVAGASGDAHDADSHSDAGHGTGGQADGGHGEGHGAHGAPKAVFEPEHGTWFNGIARSVATATGLAAPGEKGPHGPAVKYDFLIFTPILWGLLAFVLVSAARKSKIRPEGKATSSANIAESMVESYQNYLIGVMGEKLARRYLPLIASFFFTILVSNYVGLVPGMLAPSAMPSIPIALAITAFFATHIIAIKETSFKDWFMHFVGEPIWLAPLNFPLHFVGELIKPISLSLRLLCNIFGEEQVVATLIGLAILALPAWLPIPFQLPMLFLGVLFGLLQALVFSTLLAIYISVLSTHHDQHDHTEHAHDSNGHEHLVAHGHASPTA